MRLGLLQFAPIWENPKASRKLIAKTLADSPPDGLVLFLPEMCCTGFSMNEEYCAERLDGPPHDFFSDLARHYRSTIVAGLAIRDSDDFARNAACLWNADGNLGTTYIKQHPFPLTGEQDHYPPGQGSVMAYVDSVPVALFICYDLRFPETFRAVAKDVQLMAVIANWPAPRADHWHTLLRARAIENQCYVIGVNRVGTEPNGTSYAGGSCVTIRGARLFLMRAQRRGSTPSISTQPRSTSFAVTIPS